RGGPAASGLHRMNRGHRGAEKAAGLRHPPRIGDDRLPLTHLVVIPAPRLRLDRLAHRRHRLEMVLVLARLLSTERAQAANRRGRGVENVPTEPIVDTP